MKKFRLGFVYIAASQCFAFLGAVLPWAARGFRSLRRAATGAALSIPATGSALWIPASFKKLDQTF